MPDDAALADPRLERLAARIETSPHNLVSRRARAELRSRHIPECVALADLLPRSGGSVLDVGSGGGLPGLVVALVRPDLDVTLLEATAKKARFLREAAADLGVDVTVVNERAEALHVGDLAGAFDLVTARAVAALDRLVPLAVPFLRPDGLLYAVKGARWAQEVAAAAEVLARVRARVVATPDDIAALGNAVPGSTPGVVIIGRT